MKKAFFFLLLLAAAACNKISAPLSPDPSPADPTPPAKVALVKQTREVWGENGYVFDTEYEYDSKNRLIRQVNFSSPPHRSVSSTTTYTYTDSTVMVWSFVSGASDPIDTLLYKLNSKGLAVSMVSSYWADGITLYEYNADDYLTKYTELQISNGATWEHPYYYTDNVLDSNAYYTPNADLNRFHYYQYDTDKPNSLDNINYGRAFLGKQFKQPYKKKLTSWFNGAITDSVSSSFDGNQNISQQIFITKANGFEFMPDTVSYTYQ